METWVRAIAVAGVSVLYGAMIVWDQIRLRRRVNTIVERLERNSE